MSLQWLWVKLVHPYCSHRCRKALALPSDRLRRCRQSGPSRCMQRWPLSSISFCKLQLLSHLWPSIKIGTMRACSTYFVAFRRGHEKQSEHHRTVSYKLHLNYSTHQLFCGRELLLFIIKTFASGIISLENVTFLSAVYARQWHLFFSLFGHAFPFTSFHTLRSDSIRN